MCVAYGYTVTSPAPYESRIFGSFVLVLFFYFFYPMQEQEYRGSELTACSLTLLSFLPPKYFGSVFCFPNSS
jgi:hypothetical protein